MKMKMRVKMIINSDNKNYEYGKSNKNDSSNNIDNG